ncbi:MAG TPA: ferric reductase-like transmembrane domain-containing protein [Xanthomonadales bacterium]|nr:ferric reductase-like transmembrane domain-containing protein [Xanthomonadales bacterium]
MPTAVAAAWLAAYLLLVTGPVALVLMVPPLPPSSSPAWDFALALGYAALAMFGAQFALTARFKRATAPFGIDIVYYLHRYLATAAFVLVLAHAAALTLAHPAPATLYDPREASGAQLAGVAAVVLVALLIGSSLARRRVRLEYDLWRRVHAVLAAAVVVLAYLHVAGTARYLDAPAKHALWTSWSAAWLVLLAYVRVLRPWRLGRRPWRVASVVRGRGRSWTLVLVPEGHAGFDFLPGQFAWLTLRASPFALREHPFSIASAPAPDGRIEFAIKELGDFTRTIGGIVPGEVAYVDAPYGNFSVDRHPQATAYVFVAGGAGIVPVTSMLRALAQRGERRPLLLVYGNRNLEGAIHRDELEALATQLPLRIVHVLHEPPPDWAGERGWVTQALLERHLPPQRAGVHVFVCGPGGMIAATEVALGALGLPPRQVHSEIFDLMQDGATTRRDPMPLRARRARALAWLTAAAIVGFCAAIALRRDRASAPPSPSPAPRVLADPALVARGGVLFADLGCARCHSLAGQGSPASPLDDACRHRAPAELRDFIVAAPSVESRLPPRAVAAKARYRALGRSDLEALGAALCASAQTTR